MIMFFYREQPSVSCSLGFVEFFLWEIFPKGEGSHACPIPWGSLRKHRSPSPHMQHWTAGNFPTEVEGSLSGIVFMQWYTYGTIYAPPAPLTMFSVVFFLLPARQRLWKMCFITSAVLFSELFAIISCRLEVKPYFLSLPLSPGSQ